MTLPGPDFLIIGAARSGTTVIARALATHPDVAITDPKEPHFLAFAGRRPTFAGPGDDEYLNRVAVTDESAWRALFEVLPAGVRRGEGSVTTLHHSESSVENICRTCPDVAMIAVLRHPTDRAFSAWSYQVRMGVEPLTFEQALEEEDRRAALGWQHLWRYVRSGLYAEQLEPLLAAFPGQVLVVGYEDLIADQSGELERCLRFIGAQHRAISGPVLGAEVNRGGQPRSRAVATGLHALRQIGPLRRAVRGLVPYEARERVRQANLRDIELDPGTRRQLDERYAPEIERLGRLLEAEAPSWTRSA
jgi:hypothetical protein